MTKPLLSLEALLGINAAPHAAHAGLAADDLDHRLIQLLWANGEGLDTAGPTRATALLQHGFKEWSAARGVGIVPPGQDLRPALRHCEEQNWMPLVLCQDLEAPLQMLGDMRADGDCGLLALGTPGGVCGQGSLFPLSVPGGLQPDRCAWLGAPCDLPAPIPGMPAGLRVRARDLNGRNVGAQLRAVEWQFSGREPLSLWCVIFLDEVALDGKRCAAGGQLAPEVVAACLPWLQRLNTWVVCFVVSSARVMPHQRDAVAGLARQLGLACHRHRGVRRESFPASVPSGAGAALDDRWSTRESGSLGAR